MSLAIQKSGKNLWAIAGLTLAIAVIYLLAFSKGGFCSFAGFNADFCWLLKTGQLICESGHLPQQEPFSYALKEAAIDGDPQPYIIYQWLAEIVFFQMYIFLHLKAMIACSAVIYALCFIAVPLRSGARFNVSPVWLFTLIVLGSMATNVRTVFRPEMFAYIATLILLRIFQSMRRSHDRDEHVSKVQNSIEWRTIAILIPLFILTANTHISFVADVLLLLLYAALFCSDDLLGKKNLSPESNTLLIGAVSSALATLINPYGVGLWKHAWKMCFQSVATYVQEMEPLTLDLLFTNHAYYPFVLFVVFTLSSVCFSIYRSHKRTEWSPLQIGSLALIAASLAFAFHTRRYLALAVLVVMFELMNFMAFHSTFANSKKWQGFWNKKLSFAILELAVCVFAILGVVQNPYAAVLSIPSTDFQGPVPFGGVKYLIKNYDGHRLFSDQGFADMCELYLPNCAVFADTRFDGYDSLLMSDYWKALNAKQDWQKILDWYHVDWVIALHSEGLAKVLPAAKDWQRVFEDANCEIFHRRE